MLADSETDALELIEALAAEVLSPIQAQPVRSSGSIVAHRDIIYSEGGVGGGSVGGGGSLLDFAGPGPLRTEIEKPSAAPGALCVVLGSLLFMQYGSTTLLL